MRLPTVLALLAMPLAALPLAAAAQTPPARTIEDCEKITADMAYNQCLASFGPRRGERASRAVQPPPQEDEAPAVTTRNSRGRNAVARRGRGGRQSASFSPVAGEQSRATRSRATRSRYSHRSRVHRSYSTRRYGYRRRR